MNDDDDDEDENNWRKVVFEKSSTYMAEIIFWYDSSNILRKEKNITSDGRIYIYYYDNRFLHRKNGPALTVIYSAIDYYYDWYWHGKKIECKSQEEFERIIKLKAFW